jgi:hypothetical protein
MLAAPFLFYWFQRLRRAALRKGSAFPSDWPFPLCFLARLRLAEASQSAALKVGEAQPHRKKDEWGHERKGGAFPQSGAAEPLTAEQTQEFLAPRD